ncbi:hypothetical protein TNCV_1042861 [Trichonephila clavipes]|nr:hypothetical protein TNCV_1042861 [Trichonephila clavipes]
MGTLGTTTVHLPDYVVSHWVFAQYYLYKGGRQSQGTGVPRCSDSQMDLAARLHDSCSLMYNTLLQRVHSSLPQRAQAGLDMKE